MKKPVVFDLDGVLANFYAGYFELCQKLGLREPRVGSWDDFLDQRVWNEIRTSPTFWYDLPARVSRTIFDRIQATTYERDVYFATSRVGIDAYRQSYDWLFDNGIEKPSVTITGKKGEFAKVVGAGHLIDDKAGNAVYTQYESPGTQAYLLDAPYNQFDQTALGSKVVRVVSVEDFLDRLENAK